MRLIDANQLSKDIVERGAQLSGCYSAGIARYMDRMLAHVLAEVDTAPTIEVPHWIPCDLINQYYIRELKDCGDKPYLVTYVTPKGRRYVKKVNIYHGRIQGKVGKVIAWMPLPEPYEGERKDDESVDS